MAADNWNQTLRKSNAMVKLLGRSIRTTTNGVYDDRIISINQKWKKNEKLAIHEILAYVLLYIIIIIQNITMYGWI